MIAKIKSMLRRLIADINTNNFRSKSLRISSLPCIVVMKMEIICLYCNINSFVNEIETKKKNGLLTEIE